MFNSVLHPFFGALPRFSPAFCSIFPRWFEDHGDEPIEMVQAAADASNRYWWIWYGLWVFMDVYDIYMYNVYIYVYIYSYSHSYTCIYIYMFIFKSNLWLGPTL